LLFGRLWNAELEQKFLAPPDGGPCASGAISLLSVAPLEALLSEGGAAIESEEALLDALLRFGSDFFPFLRHIRWEYLSEGELASALLSVGMGLSEGLWSGISGNWRRIFGPLPFDSLIISESPEIFADFLGMAFRLRWRGSRDRFGSRDFHDRCYGRANTLTVVLDTEGNIFGGFNPREWNVAMDDPEFGSLESFLFTSKISHNFHPRMFGLKSDRGSAGIGPDIAWGPYFGDIGVADDCNANSLSSVGSFGQSYVNDTGLPGETFFARSANFTVKEI
jgi:hypothetical protein